MNIRNGLIQSTIIILPCALIACSEQPGEIPTAAEQTADQAPTTPAQEQRRDTSTPTTEATATLSFLESVWSGTLTYLDYQDNTSQVTLPMTAEFEGANLRFIGNYAFTEPNGSIVTDTSTVELSEDGSTLTVGDSSFRVTELTSTQAGDQHTILGQSDADGSFNKITIIHNNATLDITNSFSNDEGQTWTVRNNYSLTRTDG